MLKNATGSVRVGVEDSCSTDSARLLSAVRNIHSGILLLYKEALRRLSPPDSDEVLLKAVIRPKRQSDGAVSFVGWGRKTVDVWQIVQRFADLGIKTDWQRFKRISKLRNDAEHYYPQASTEQLRAMISNAFVLVRDFVVTQLHEDPRPLLGEEAWQRMLEVSEVYERERKECENMLQSITWASDALENGVVNLECEACGSGLLQPNKASGYWHEVELGCRACGESEDADSFVPRAIAVALGQEMYLSHTDGNETPYVQCPECLAEAYVIEEGRCALCEHEADHTCARCGTAIPPEELGSSPLCGYCDHVMSKDD